MGFVLAILVVASALWVGTDAAKLLKTGTPKEALGNTSPIAWAIGCILLWIVAFPWYLIVRARRYQYAASGTNSPLPTASAAARAATSPAAGWYTDPTNKLQQRYWDGVAWTMQERPLPPPA
jgi:hypothetical protein